MIEILHIGFEAQLVDKGRRLSSHLGFAASGALDWQSYEFANALVGNSPFTKTSNVSIEITLGDVSMRFQKATIIALSGALAECRINNEICDMHRPVSVPEGAVLSISNIGANRQGVRVYLAVKGSIDVPSLFASASNVKREGSGGLHEDGSSLREGDLLALSLATKNDKRRVDMINKTTESLQQYWGDFSDRFLQRHFLGRAPLGVVPSYQWSSFTASERMKFLSSVFTISPDCDRMGMRLLGNPIQSNGRKLYSQGLCNGAIQCAGDGQLFIMLNDRQSIGGYPVLGAVDAFSRARLAQKRIGESFDFEIANELDITASISVFYAQIKKLATWVDKHLTS